MESKDKRTTKYVKLLIGFDDDEKELIDSIWSMDGVVSVEKK